MRPESKRVLPALVGLTLTAVVPASSPAQTPAPARDPVRATAYTPTVTPTTAMSPAPVLAPAMAPTSVHPPFPASTPNPAALAALSGARPGQVAPTAPTAPTARPAPNAVSAPAGYWGAAPTPVPPKKPSALRRMFNRVGTFLGADEEMGTTPVTFDKTTGRSTPGTSTKPWMK